MLLLQLLVLVLPDATTVTFPNFVATDRVTADSATSITLKSIAATNILAEDATSLSVTSQDVVFTLTDATRVANLGSLNLYLLLVLVLRNVAL